MGEKFEIEISGVAYGGDGVGRLENFVYFIPGVLSGERILAAETAKKKNFGRARALKILRNSQDRIPPECPVAVCASENENARYCPGCAYRHVEYKEEIRFKTLQFEKFLSDSSASPTKLKPGKIHPSPQSDAYRNKIVLHFSEGRLGYFADDNKSVLDVGSCPIADSAVNSLLAEFRGAEVKFLRDGDNVLFRHAAGGGAVFLRPGGKKQKWLEEKTAAGNFLVPPDGFSQVNPGAADILFVSVSEKIKRFAPDFVADLYCGCGVFSIIAAENGVPSVTGIDSDREAVKAAEVNAKTHGVGGKCSFASARAENFSAELKGFSTLPGNSLLVLDPPRGGLSREIKEKIAGEWNFRRVIYVSCAPDTLSRDLKYLSENGYFPVETELIDMFPRTSHFETVTVLER